MGYELRRRLQLVDTNLKIIPGGCHRKPMSQRDWEGSAGKPCPICGQDTVRLKEITQGKWGCPDCHRKAVEEYTKIEASLHYWLNSGEPSMVHRARRLLMKHMPK